MAKKFEEEEELEEFEELEEEVPGFKKPMGFSKSLKDVRSNDIERDIKQNIAPRPKPYQPKEEDYFGEEEEEQPKRITKPSRMKPQPKEEFEEPHQCCGNCNGGERDVI